MDTGALAIHAVPRGDWPAAAAICTESLGSREATVEAATPAWSHGDAAHRAYWRPTAWKAGEKA